MGKAKRSKLIKVNSWRGWEGRMSAFNVGWRDRMYGFNNIANKVAFRAILPMNMQVLIIASHGRALFGQSRGGTDKRGLG